MYLGEQEMFFPSWQCCKLFFLPLNTIKLLRQHAPNRGRAAFQLRQTILGSVWAQKRDILGILATTVTLLQFLMLFFKTSIWNSFSFYIKSNALDWTGKSDPTFVQKKKRKNTQVGRFSCPLKVKPGQMIKKGKNSVQYFLTKWWNTEFQVNAILCVWVYFTVSLGKNDAMVSEGSSPAPLDPSLTTGQFILIKVCLQSIFSSQLFVQLS